MLPATDARPWLTEPARRREQDLLEGFVGQSVAELDDRLAGLVARNRVIHERQCVQLNPAANVMNPRAEAALAAGLGSRPSLGWPGDKYETGLEAVEQIEVLAAALAGRVFAAPYAEIRLTSGAVANLAAFMATCRPGDRILVPPAQIGGHVTHHHPGAAGLYGLEVHHFAVDAQRYTVDLDALAAQAEQLRPRLITIGGSLNLLAHPVAGVREIADRVGAAVLFDAAHVSGLLAGRQWPDPLADGADLVTMSTYKSLGGPPGGLVLTADADLAQRVDRIAFPGLTANFDAGVSAALAISLLDWIDHGREYARAMVDTAGALAAALADEGLPVWRTVDGPTRSHQLALDAADWGGGAATAARLRRGNILASGIGLPGREPDAGLRMGTPEIVRWGMEAADMAELAHLIARALSGDPAAVAAATTIFRSRFTRLHHIRA